MRKEVIIMARIKITVVSGACRDGFYAEGDSWVCEGVCPPLCYELAQRILQYLYCLENGGTIDGDKFFTVTCPDCGTPSGAPHVVIRGEVIE